LPGREDRLDVTQLGQLLRDRRGELSIRRAAAEAGVSFSTFSRVENGAHPDLATFTRLCSWLGLPPARFFGGIAERGLTPLEEAIAHLRADPRLTADTAKRINSVLTDLYAALARKPAASESTVACHLRAKAVMRPGVAPRLAALLRDFQAELDRRTTAGEP
jgi:transcriptional regulator with XRE-family HTH domain